MFSHPELGSNPLNGSGRESGRDRGGRQKKQKETERSRRNKRENQRVIIIARRMMTIKP